jgi:hypothetical protein
VCATFGRVSNVLRIVLAISSPISRGAPGRGSSEIPSIRRSAKRLRHVPTVAAQTLILAAISLLLSC